MSKVRLTREEFEIIIKNYKVAGRDTTELEAALAEAYPERKVEVGKRRIATGEIEPRPAEFVSPEILEIESRYSLSELKDMAKNQGLKYTGTKDILCLRLIRAGIIRR